MADLKLSVVLSLIEKATAPLKSITGQATQSAKALRDTRQRLRDLEKTQGAINTFRSTARAARTLAADLKATRERAAAAGAAMAATTNPTRKQRQEFAQLRAEVKTAERAYTANAAKLRSVREELGAAGIDTKKLASAQRGLASQIASTNSQLQAQQQRAAAVGAQQQAARSQLHGTQGIAGNMAIAGAASLATGQHLLGGLRPTIDEAKAFQQQVAQLRATGVGDAAVDDAVKFARGMDIMGSSATDNLKLLKEANSVLRDMHEAEEVTPYLARMKFGIEAVMAQGGHGDGHGDNAEAMFMDLLKVAELRGAAKNPESLKRVLDYATQAYVASGGLVKPEDLLNMIKTGGVAAKQLDDTSFFFGLLHTMQEMGGHRAGTGLATAYQNWAAGRSTHQAADELFQLGLLKKNSVVTYEKTGHLKKLLPDALKDGELYRSNPFEFLMTRVIPKINPHGNLSDQQVVSKINALFSGRKGGDLFASMYMERANIAKHVPAAPKAYGVDALYREAGGTAGGMELDLESKKRDLYRELGRQLLPTYVSGLTKLLAVVKSLTGFAERHPMLTRAMSMTAASIGVVATAAGGLMIALAGVIGQFALLRYAVKAAGIRFGAGAAGAAEAATGGAASAGQAGVLARIGTVARGALAALASIPGVVLVIVAVLVAAALLVRKYWGPISAWLQGVGQGIQQALGPALSRLGEALGPVAEGFRIIGTWLGQAWQWFMQLLAPVNATQQQLDAARGAGVSFGSVIGAVLASVIDVVTRGVGMFVAIGQAIGTAAGWVMTSWGPLTDFFAGIWKGVADGAASAMAWVQQKVEAVRAVIERLYAMWQKISGQGGTAEPLQWIMPGDTDRARQVADAIARNPIGTAGNSTSMIATPQRVAPAAAATSSYTVNVDARGMHPDQARDAVHQALQQHERQAAAKRRSAYTDED